MFPGTVVEQHDDQQAQQCKGDVAQDAPGQRGVVGQPLVLRHHAQHDAHSGKGVHGNGQILLALDLVALAPDVVQQYIEHGHGHGGDPLAQAQRHSVAFQAGGAQCQGTGHQMEGVTCAQHHGHQTEQAELGAVLAAADHADAQGQHGDQIEDVENGLNDCSHKNVAPLRLVCFSIAIRSAIAGRTASL